MHSNTSIQFQSRLFIVVAPYPNINIIISLTNLVLILNWRFFKAAKIATALKLVKKELHYTSCAIGD
jgi:hypothetical protein